MSKTQKITLLIAGVFVVALVILGVSTRIGKDDESISKVGEKEESADVTAEESATGTKVKAPPPTYTAEVPKDATSTKPKEEVSISANSTAKLGLFEIKISKKGFTPNEITVKQNNAVRIEVIAEDADYDFSIPYFGIYQKVLKGETRDIGFDATNTGTVSFECRDFCPSSGKIRGEFIVMP